MRVNNFSLPKTTQVMEINDNRDFQIIEKQWCKHVSNFY